MVQDGIVVCAEWVPGIVPDRMCALLNSALSFSLTTVIFAIITSLAVAMVVILALLIIQKERQEAPALFALVFVVGLIATITGYVMGNARVSPIGDAAPVLLGGMGALFVFGVIQKHISPVLACAVATAFALPFLAGLDAGSINREGYHAQTAAVAPSAPQKVELQIRVAQAVEPSVSLRYGNAPAPAGHSEVEVQMSDELVKKLCLSSGEPEDCEAQQEKFVFHPNYRLRDDLERYLVQGSRAADWNAGLLDGLTLVPRDGTALSVEDHEFYEQRLRGQVLQHLGGQ